MKKIYLLPLLLFAAVTFNPNQVKAQEDVTLNFLGAIFGNYGIHYEHVLNESMGVGAGISFYNYKLKGADESYKWTGFNFAPDFRFYFSPDDDAEGFFAGPYIKVRSAKSTGWDYLDSDLEWQTDGVRKYFGIAAGVVLGRKWVSRSGFMFESFGGIGKYLSEKTTWDPADAEEYYSNDGIEITNLSSLDIRLGLSIGWRFGG